MLVELLWVILRASGSKKVPSGKFKLIAQFAQRLLCLKLAFVSSIFLAYSNEIAAYITS